MFNTIISEVIAILIAAILTSLVTTYFNKKLRLKQQIRLGKNLNRPIAFILNEASLQNDEVNLIKDCGLFKDVVVFGKAKNFTFNKDYGLIVYVFNGGNNQDSSNIVESARGRNLPIILYANGLQLSDTQKSEVNSIMAYPKHHMTQYTLNLLSAIFTTLSTYNHGTGK